MEIELTVYFSPTQLLAEYQEWGPVRQDLEGIPAPFPVGPLLKK